MFKQFILVKDRCCLSESRSKRVLLQLFTRTFLSSYGSVVIIRVASFQKLKISKAIKINQVSMKNDDFMIKKHLFRALKVVENSQNTFTAKYVFQNCKLLIYSLRPTRKSKTISENWKPFKNDEKCFLFHVKSSFLSWDIYFLSWLFSYVGKRLDKKFSSFLALCKFSVYRLLLILTLYFAMS